MTLRSEAEREADLAGSDLRETWRLLAPDERYEAFIELEREDAEEFFFELQARDQMELLMAFPAAQRRSWMRLLPPDDAADVVQ